MTNTLPQAFGAYPPAKIPAIKDTIKSKKQLSRFPIIEKLFKKPDVNLEAEQPVQPKSIYTSIPSQDWQYVSAKNQINSSLVKSVGILNKEDTHCSSCNKLIDDMGYNLNNNQSDDQIYICDSCYRLWYPNEEVVTKSKEYSNLEEKTIDEIFDLDNESMKVVRKNPFDDESEMNVKRKSYSVI